MRVLRHVWNLRPRVTAIWTGSLLRRLAVDQETFQRFDTGPPNPVVRSELDAVFAQVMLWRCPLGEDSGEPVSIFCLLFYCHAPPRAVRFRYCPHPAFPTNLP